MSGTLSFDPYRQSGAYILNTSNVGATGQHRGRIKAPLVAGKGVLEAGTVLGKVTASGEYTIIDPSASDGSEVAVAVLFSKQDTGTVDDPIAVTNAPIDVGEIQVDFAGLLFPEGLTNTQIDTAVDTLTENGVLVHVSST